MKQLDEMTDAELRTYLAGLAKIGKLQKTAMDNAKAEAQHRGLALDDAEDVTFDGEKVGVLLATHDGTGKYTVDDPIAYANVLHDIKAQVPGGKNAWQTVNYPKPEATTAEYLRDLITAHDGELPAGVAYKPGRRGVITVRLDRAFVHKPFTLESFANLGLLEASK
ncbi:hypothetical protein CSQ85_00335 [Bifidobacterium rousetti]|uniref:hypothetical protein n=1 Tax=Bifidobacterium rousetti TaxID=2045439 RepID=UPI00123C78AA|nr:hypothetical protein [Bifidobacterium rousetti]KAA8820298.1 hypothetical protein CSQ85_00335 [Bifidobacterium rousetti]